MQETRARWILRNASLAAVFLLLWNTPALTPLRLAVVFVHEIFHALSALASGGGVHTIEITAGQLGRTALYGGLPVLVYSAGYVGTALLGGALLATGQNYPFKRSLYLALGVLILANTLLFVRHPFGWACGLVIGLFFLLLAFREFPFSAYVTDLIGLLCLLDTLIDLTGFLLAPGRNDAALLAGSSGLGYYPIAAAWLLMSLGLGSASVALALWGLAPERLAREVWLGEFRCVTRGSVRRRRSMLREEELRRRRRARSTLIVYLSVLAAIVLAVLYASRFVLFRPWTAREWLAATAADHRIYTAGGRDSLGLIYDEVFRIDPGGSRIARIGRLPSPRFGLGLAAWEGQIYLAGGFDGRRCFAEVLAFTAPRGGLRGAGLLPGPRAFGGAACLRGALYYLGGWDGTRELDEIVRLDPSTGRSRIIGRLPSARSAAAAAALGGRLYLFGGSDAGGGYLDEVLEIDPERGTVLRRGRLPAPRTRMCAAAGQDRVFAFGGWEGRRIDELLAVDPREPRLEARLICRPGRPLSDGALVYLDGKLYLLGGSHERFERQLGVLRIDPEDGRGQSVRFKGFLFW
jgi:hypothetical protein